MWSLYENEKELKPLVFSNGKSQEDVVNEVINAVKQGHKIIFIRGVCGTGKSAIALNLAKKIGKTSIVVPIKSLQEQYINDYTEKKYLLKNNKKLKICPIVGRINFKCRFLQENKQELGNLQPKEKNTTLMNFEKPMLLNKQDNDSCDNNYLPCKIEIKEKNIDKLKQYIKQNPDINLSDFDSINEIKRMSIAPICPYWCPIVPEEFEIHKFKNSNKIKYSGLNNIQFVIYQRKKGCPYYDQYEAYADSDVLIFNSLKYKLETLMDRKPLTELEIIDECDEFLDSFANQEQINTSRLLFSLTNIFSEKQEAEELINELIDITNAIKRKYKPSSETFEIKNTLIHKLLKILLDNPELIYETEITESNYLYHLDKVARTFEDFFDETFFSVEKKENDLIIHLVTTNLEKRLKELLEKNKIIIMMSGTIHSEDVLKNIFGLKDFKIIIAETQQQGQLIPCKNGYEINCKYENFKNHKITREQYLLTLSKTVACAKLPILVQINSFSDLPTDNEKTKFNISNLPAVQELISQQNNDPFGQRVTDFKKGKTKILFTTKCSRGIDFPGDTCNSIIITKFPYPDISSLFWKILKKTHPSHFMSFYTDKANRELHQKIYRGLRSKTDRIYLLSPDIRVLDAKIS